jgi:hypothetical protein
MTNCESELHEMLEAGPASDVFRADESRALFQVIAEHGKAVDASTFAPTFVALQAYSVEQFILAITRLYDKPKKKYSLRSLPAIIEHVMAQADALPSHEPTMLANALRHLGAPIAGLDAVSGSAATKIAMAALTRLMPSPDTHHALDALKAIRDKRLAHQENVKVETLPRTAWAPADELVHTAKLMLGALGTLTRVMYLDTAGTYFLASDAQRASIATHRLLRRLEIAPPLPHEQGTV